MIVPISQLKKKINDFPDSPENLFEPVTCRSHKMSLLFFKASGDFPNSFRNRACYKREPLEKTGLLSGRDCSQVLSGWASKHREGLQVCTSGTRSRDASQQTEV